eukprot:826184_1
MVVLIISLFLYICHGYNSVSDPECMELHCHKEWEACREDEVCLKLMTCSGYCMDQWDNDPTQQKVHAQNCTVKCGASYEDDVSDAYMACMFTYHCVTFPPMNITCPVSQLSKATAPNATLYDLSGEWWQHYGYNALWDCYPCQHIHSMVVYNESSWA